MDISPGPPFWRIKPSDMDIPPLDHRAISGRPDADIHAGVNFAMKLSENPHERANFLAIRRLIAT